MAGPKEILRQIPTPLATVMAIAGIWAIQTLSIAPINRELAKINNSNIRSAAELFSFISLWFLQMGGAVGMIGAVEKIRAEEGNSSID